MNCPFCGTNQILYAMIQGDPIHWECGSCEYPKFKAEPERVQSELCMFRQMFPIRPWDKSYVGTEFTLTLFDDVGKKLEIMSALEAMFDDERNVIPEKYWEIVERIKPGQRLRIAVSLID